MHQTANPNFAPTHSNLGSSVSDLTSTILQPPPVAHVAGSASTNELRNTSTIPLRPMHFIRAPSYNPPAFDAEDMPPPFQTPPPEYDSIASPTTGMADYFARLSDSHSVEDSVEIASEESDGGSTPRGSIILIESPITTIDSQSESETESEGSTAGKIEETTQDNTT
jgi:hypothetical protein